MDQVWLPISSSSSTVGELAVAVDVVAHHEERGLGPGRLERIEDLWRPARIGAVVEGQGHIGLLGPDVPQHPVDAAQLVVRRRRPELSMIFRSVSPSLRFDSPV